MQQIKLTLVLAVTLAGFLFSGNLYGQQQEDKARSGSIYSYLGVGIPENRTNTGISSTGLSGVAVNDMYSPGLSNPGVWGNTYFTKASGDFTIQNYNAEDNTTTAENSLLGVGTLNIVFPISKNRLGMSLNLHPLTRSTFRTFQITDLPPEGNNSPDSLSYAEENKGYGGLSQFEVGIGWRLVDQLSIGYATSVIFGEIENQTSVIFGDTGYDDIAFNRQTSFSGWGHRFGIYGEFRSLFSSNDRLSYGAALSLSAKLDANQETTTDRVVGNSLETVTIGETDFDGRKVTYPMETTVGLKYNFSPSIGIVGDVLYQEWSEYDNFISTRQDITKDRYKFGLGMRYMPYKIEDIDSFFSNTKYRAGLTYDTGHLELQGKNISTIMGSFGFSILSPDTRSSIDITFQYGIRGTKDEGLVREEIFGMNVSFNLTELMFYRPRLR